MLTYNDKAQHQLAAINVSMKMLSLIISETILTYN